LLSFIALPDVATKLKPLRPKGPRKLDVLLMIEPRSPSYSLVGTAFDYLLRFELQRRAPHAVSDRWVADLAPGIIYRSSNGVSVLRDFLADPNPAHYLPPGEVLKRMQRLLKDAHAAVAAYLDLADPAPATLADLAGHAIRMAKLDLVCRAEKLEADFEEASSEDVQDLVGLLGSSRSANWSTIS